MNISKIKTSDIVLGSLFILGTIVGILGNGVAFCFFLPRRKRTIHDLLYMAITAVDFVTVSSSFPVIATLFNERESTLFANDTFCTGWISLVQFTAKISIFLAMIICINRTIIMIHPNRPINRTCVIVAIAVYAVFGIILDVLYLSQSWGFAFYDKFRASCSITIQGRSQLLFILKIIRVVSFVVGFLVPTLITTVCFVVGIRILMTRPALGNEDNIRYRRVSVTISIFTGVFLIFNTPFILSLILELLSFINLVSLYRDYEIWDHYMILILQTLPMFLNAVVNPVLYALRIRDFQNWIRQALKKITGTCNCRPNN